MSRYFAWRWITYHFIVANVSVRRLQRIQSRMNSVDFLSPTAQRNSKFIRCPQVKRQLTATCCLGTAHIFQKIMLSSNDSECISGSEKASTMNSFDFYVYVDHHCRQTAAKESKDLEQFAECLSTSRTKQDDNFLKNLSTKAESYIFEQMQQNVFRELWQEASKAVYGQ